MEWISVKDRLPKVGTGCVVWYKSKYTYAHIRTATYLGSNYFSTTGIQHQTFEITHWMPIPEPPKEK